MYEDPQSDFILLGEERIPNADRAEKFETRRGITMMHGNSWLP